MMRTLFTLLIVLGFIIFPKNTLAQVSFDAPEVVRPKQTFFITLQAPAESATYIVEVYYMEKGSKVNLYTTTVTCSLTKRCAEVLSVTAPDQEETDLFLVACSSSRRNPETISCQDKAPIAQKGIRVRTVSEQPKPSPKAQEKTNLGEIQKLSGIQLPFTTVGGFISSAVPILMTIAGILLLFYLIWGGISWMLSQGDPKAIAQAQGRITTAIIGFVIIFLAFWLVQILGKILRITQFGEVFK